MSKLIPLYKAGAQHTVHTLITELAEKVDSIEELYVVVKDKDGNFQESLCGDMAGVCFAALLLQKFALENV